MRKFLIFTLMLFFAGSTSFAQDAKERKEMMNVSKSELNAKATKAARKEAKRLKKEGWTTTPGALPIEKQLDKSYLMQYQYDEDMYPKYIMGEAMSIGQNYDAAKMQALELAKQSLVGQIQTEVNALIQNLVANKQLSSDEAASVVQIISSGKSLISQNIGRTIPVIEVYRNTGNKNKEVLVRIAYDGDMAKKAAKNVVHKDLEQRGDELHKKLEELLGW